MRNNYNIYFSPNSFGTGPSTIHNLVMDNFKDKNSNWIFIIPKSLNKPKLINFQNNYKQLLIPNNFLKYIFIILSYIYVYILTKFYKIDKVIIATNYLPFKIRANNIKLLVRHPYLVINPSLNQLSIKRFIQEKMRRFIFKLTLRNECKIYLQTPEMENLFIKSYPNINKNKLAILPNPISKEIFSILKKKHIYSNHITYPSTYYEHKNFEYLILFANYIYENKIKFNYKINLYISEKIFFEICKKLKLNHEYLKSYFKLNDLKSHIEVLEEIYNSILIIFPSKLETYGNGIYESINLKKNIIINQSNYSNNFLKLNQVTIFNMNNTDNFKEFYSLLENIIKNKSELKTINRLFSINDYILNLKS